MKTIIIGVMPQEQIRARIVAIAKGEYKPKLGEPKIWFTSMKSVAEVLSDQPGRQRCARRTRAHDQDIDLLHNPASPALKGGSVLYRRLVVNEIG